MASPELDSGEKLLVEWRPDPGRYWRDHGVMALLGMTGAGLVLWLLDVPHAAIGALDAVLAIGVRALYLRSETLAMVWRLTDRRVLLPSGGSVGLMEIETQRKLFGDVQLITRSGDKHLLRHMPDPASVLSALEGARSRRARRRD